MVRNHQDREFVATQLKECLRFVSGKPVSDDIPDGTFVIKEWELDSEHGIELACDLSARLGINIPQEDNPLILEFGASKSKRARTFGEIVDYLMKLGNA